MKVSRGEICELYRVYEFQIDDERILNDFGSIANFEGFLTGKNIDDEELDSLYEKFGSPSEYLDNDHVQQGDVHSVEGDNTAEGYVVGELTPGRRMWGELDE